MWVGVRAKNGLSCRRIFCLGIGDTGSEATSAQHRAARKEGILVADDADARRGSRDG